MTATLQRPQAPATSALSLPPVSLDELNERAALQKRFDSKFLVAAEQARDLPLHLPHGSRALQIGDRQSFSYCSFYFDTPDLRTYRDAAHGRRRRFKVRTRAYLDSDIAFLEVKTKGNRGGTEKARKPHAVDGLRSLSAHDREFITTQLLSAGIDPTPVCCLEPTLITGFERSTYLVPDARGDIRVTVDTGPYWEQLPRSDGWDVESEETNMLMRPTLGIIEVKSPSPSSPVSRLLWQMGLRAHSVSKYCVGSAAFDPRLPSNKWNRALKTVLAP